MDVSVTSALEECVRRKVATGLYNNASEVVREAFRLMVERDAGAHPVAKVRPDILWHVRTNRLAALKAAAARMLARFENDGE